MSFLSNAAARIYNRGLNISLLNRINKCRHGSSYEGPGKMTVNVMSKDIDSGLMVQAFSLVGFRFTNGVSVMGPVILFPKTVLSWNVKNALDINRESLCLFDVIEPKVDILVIGVGDQSNMKLASKLYLLSKVFKTNIEVLPTEHAIASFNFLTVENRNVAAALIPPETITVTDDDLVASGDLQKIVDAGF